VIEGLAPVALFLQLFLFVSGTGCRMRLTLWMPISVQHRCPEK
jgi:hypothetical protein